MSNTVNQPKSTGKSWNRFCREQALKIQTDANKFHNSTYIKPEDRGVAGTIFAMPAATARTLATFVGWDIPAMFLDPTTLVEGVGNMTAPLTYSYGEIQPTYIDNADGKRKYLATDDETGKAKENDSAAGGDFTKQPIRATIGTFGNLARQATKAGNDDKLNAIGSAVGWMLMAGGSLKGLSKASTLSKTYKISSFIGMNAFFGAMDNMHISQNMLTDTTMPAALFSDLENCTPEMKETLENHILSQLRHELKQAPTEVFSSDYPDKNLETFLKISDKIVSYNGNIENNNILPVIADYLNIGIGATNNSEAYETCMSELGDGRSYSGKVDSLIRFATASLPDDSSIETFKNDLQACDNDDNAKLTVIYKLISNLGQDTIDENQFQQIFQQNFQQRLQQNFQNAPDQATKMKVMEHYLARLLNDDEKEQFKQNLSSAENDQEKLNILLSYLSPTVSHFAHREFMNEFKNFGDDKNRQLDFLTDKLFSDSTEKEIKEIKTELANKNDYSDKLKYLLSNTSPEIYNRLNDFALDDSALLATLTTIAAEVHAGQAVEEINNSLIKINTTPETSSEEKTSASVQVMCDAMIGMGGEMSKAFTPAIENLKFNDLFKYELLQAQNLDDLILEETYTNNWNAKLAALAQLRQMAIDANAFGLNEQKQPRTPEEALQTPHLMLNNKERLAYLNYSLFANKIGEDYSIDKLPYMLNNLSLTFEADKHLPNDPMVKEMCELSGKEFFDAYTNDGNMDNFLIKARQILDHPTCTPENKLWALMLLDKKAKESRAFTETLYGEGLSATDAIFLGYKGTNKELYSFVENKMYELILNAYSSVEAE